MKLSVVFLVVANLFIVLVKDVSGKADKDKMKQRCPKNKAEKRAIGLVGILEDVLPIDCI